MNHPGYETLYRESRPRRLSWAERKDAAKTVFYTAGAVLAVVALTAIGVAAGLILRATW